MKETKLSSSSSKITVKVYSPQSAIARPGKLIVDVFESFNEGRFLGWRLFLRNIRAMYRQSVLGLLWAFIPPLITALIWVFLQGQKVFSVESTPIPYPAFVLTGTILWQVFLDSINIPLRVISQSKTMLTKINFPREALIIASFYEIVFNFLVKAILLVGVFLWFGISVHLTVFFGILGIFALILIGLSVSLTLSPLAVLYGDVQRGILLITQFLFFLTPIIYPKPTNGIAQKVVDINPLAHVITDTRIWLTTGDVTDVNIFIGITVGFFALLLCGIVLFKVALPHLIERIGS